jgi:hypothetical protein
LCPSSRQGAEFDELVNMTKPAPWRVSADWTVPQTKMNRHLERRSS